MLLDPVAVTYVQGCGIHKADARAFPPAQAYKKGQGKCCIGHEFHKTVIAYQMREEASVPGGNKAGIVPFEGAVPGQVEHCADGHDFAQGKGTWRLQGCPGRIQWQAALFHVRNKFLAKVVNLKKN